MPTLHVLDSDTLMSAIELIEQLNWHYKVTTKDESEKPSEILKVLRHALTKHQPKTTFEQRQYDEI